MGLYIEQSTRMWDRAGRWTPQWAIFLRERKHIDIYPTRHYSEGEMAGNEEDKVILQLEALFDSLKRRCPKRFHQQSAQRFSSSAQGKASSMHEA